VAFGLFFLSALEIGGEGGPEESLHFAPLAIFILPFVFWLDNRRDRAAR